MRDLLHVLDDAGLWLAAVTAGLGALGWLMVRAVKGARRLRRWGREWAERFSAIEGLVHHELTPNSGTSVKDSLKRLEQHLERVDGRSLMVAGMVAQRNAEGRAYVDLVREHLAAQGITLPLPPHLTTDPQEAPDGPPL